MAQWKPGVNFILILSLISFSENGVVYSSETPMALPRNLHGFAPFSSFLRMKMSIWGHGSLLGHALQAAQGRSVSHRPLPGSAACPAPPAPLLRASRAQEKCHGRCWVILTNGRVNSTGSTPLIEAFLDKNGTWGSGKLQPTSC